MNRIVARPPPLRPGSPCRCSPAACGASPDPVYYTIAVAHRPDLARAVRKVVHAEGHRPGELSRPPRDRALVGRATSSTSGPTTGGASRWAACWAACWSSSSRSACPAARSTAKAAPSPPTPTAVVGVNIQRLDADKAGTLILLAQVAVEFNRPRRTAARTFTISKPLADAGHAGPGGGDQRRRGRARRRHRDAAAVDATALC